MELTIQESELGNEYNGYILGKDKGSLPVKKYKVEIPGIKQHQYFIGRLNHIERPLIVWFHGWAHILNTIPHIFG